MVCCCIVFLVPMSFHLASPLFCYQHYFHNILFRYHSFFVRMRSLLSSRLHYSTSGRLVGLLVTMAVGSAVLFLPIFGIVAFEQMLYFAGKACQHLDACARTIPGRIPTKQHWCRCLYLSNQLDAGGFEVFNRRTTSYACMTGYAHKLA